MKKITVTREFEPITKTITSCRECPWFRQEHDMSITIPYCEHPMYMGSLYHGLNILSDIPPSYENKQIISKNCPYLKL